MAVLGKAGGGGAISNFPIWFMESTTWACPVAMEAIVFVIGGGGAGAGAEDSVGTSRVQGGCAGGCAVSKLTLAAQDYTVTVGAGGAAANVTSATQAGNDGADSSFAGSGISTMTGTHGDGGHAATTGTTVDAQTGGTASGGNLMNNTGGGQLAIGTDGYVNSGGSVGLFGPGSISQQTTSTPSSGSYTSAYPATPAGDEPAGMGRDAGGQTGAQNWSIPMLNLETTIRVAEARPNSTLNEQQFRNRVGQNATWFPNGYLHSSSGVNWYHYLPVGTPLCGAGGVHSKYRYLYGGSASLGGGGGAQYSSESGSAYTVTGGGGNGGVIIIPLSLGS